MVNEVSVDNSVNSSCVESMCSYMHWRSQKEFATGVRKVVIFDSGRRFPGLP